LGNRPRAQNRKELYNNRLREAEAQIKSGKYISQQELESEYEKGIA
jgi:hypothetical protein